jgi:NitT/TauT family transport system substrate-binding protein
VRLGLGTLKPNALHQTILMFNRLQILIEPLFRRILLVLNQGRSLSFLFVSTVILSLILHGCGTQSPSLETLRVGIPHWVGFDIVLYAQEEGIFEEHGLDVELVRFESSQDATRAMLRGSLDASFTSLWDVLQSDPGGDSPAVVLVTNISHGADGIVSQPGIQSVADLQGKRVAAKLGTVNHLILLEALKLHQIPPDKVTVEDLSNEFASELMKQGQLDGAVIWEPLLGETAQATQGNIIFTTDELDSLVIDVMATRSSLAQTQPQALTRLLEAWLDIMHAVDTQPDEVFEIVGAQLGQTGDEFASDYAGLKKGDIAMQQQMFESGRLAEAIAQMSEMLKSDPRAGRMPRQDVEIKGDIVQAAIEAWNR